MSIESIVSQVHSKPGYSLLDTNAIGQATSRAGFETELALLWKSTFLDQSAYGGPNGYVEPTVEEVQRLYDATTGVSGDPVTVNGFVYGVLAYQLFLETATDPRWQGYIDSQRFTANDSGNPKDETLLQNMLNAASGLKVSNGFLDLLNSTPSSAEQIKSAGGIPTMAPSQASLDLGIPNIDAVSKSLIEVYIGYFNRAPEASGLSYWHDKIVADMNSGASLGDSIAKEASDFWPAASVTYSNITGYNDSMSNHDFVAKVYSSVLGRPDASQTDPSGIQYWVDKLDSHSINTRGEFITQLINGAHDFITALPNDGVSLFVNSYLSNRIDVASVFSQQQYSGGLSGDAAVNAGIAVLSGVTSNTDSVKASIDQIHGHTTIELSGTSTLDVHHQVA